MGRRLRVCAAVDDALTKACLFQSLEEGKALTGQVVAPDQHGGAVIQIQQALHADLAQQGETQSDTDADDLCMTPGLDLLARDFHFGLESVEGTVDHAITHTSAILFFLPALPSV